MIIPHPRQSALQILIEVEEEEIFLDPLMDREYEKLTSQDRALLKELVYGTLQWRGYLDWIIDRYADRKTYRMGLFVRNGLRVRGYYLLFFHPHPPLFPPH